MVNTSRQMKAYCVKVMVPIQQLMDLVTMVTGVGTRWMDKVSSEGVKTWFCILRSFVVFYGHVKPFNPKISFFILFSNSPHCLPNNHTMVIWEFDIRSITNFLIDIFLCFHHLSIWYCVDILRKNSAMVTHWS